MKKIFVFAVVLVLIGSTLAQAVQTIKATSAPLEKLLTEKEIICTIDFAVNSSELSREAKNILSDAVQRIKSVDLDKKMIRIEGFSSPEGNKLNNFRLSIDRARSVERFLHDNHGVSLEHYISGFGSTVPKGVPAAGKRSVQIAIYNNPWGQGEAPEGGN